MTVGEQSPAVAPVAEPDPGLGGLVAQRDAPVGGQAVLEGVMMRGIRTWAVACRAPAPEGSPEGTLGESLRLLGAHVMATTSRAWRRDA